jgi:hypothetical protein
MKNDFHERIEKLKELEVLFESELHIFTESSELLNEHHSDLEWDKKAELEGTVQRSREKLIDLQRLIDRTAGPGIPLSQLGRLGGRSHE